MTTDPTRSAGPRDGRGPARRRPLVARPDRGASRPCRAPGPCPERLADHRPRPRPRRGRRRRPPARGGPRGGSAALDATHPLLGIPVALKDLVSVRGGQCTAGSRILDGYRAPYDAHITERLHDVGAVDPRQDEHGRVRDGLLDRALGLRPDGQPVGPRPRPGWQQRRFGRRRRRVPRSAGRSARTPAAPSASRRPCPASSGSSRRTGGSVATGSSPSPRRSTRSGRSPAMSAMPRRSCTPSPAATNGTPRPRPSRCPRPSCTCRPTDDEAAATLRGKRLGLPREYFVAGMEPGVEARIREAVAALEAAGADGRGRQPAAHRVRPRDVLHRRAGRGVGQPRPLRRHPLRSAARRGPGRARRLPRDARATASGPR